VKLKDRHSATQIKAFLLATALFLIVAAVAVTGR